MKDVLVVCNTAVREYDAGVHVAAVKADFLLPASGCSLLDAGTLRRVETPTCDPGVYRVVPRAHEDRYQTACCRICRGGKEHGSLIAPCACSGTIKHVHRKCLLAWVLRQSKATCEVCSKPFVMSKLYTQQAPNIEDANVMWGLVTSTAAKVADALAVYGMQVLKWAVCAPMLMTMLFQCANWFAPAALAAEPKASGTSAAVFVFGLITDGIGIFGVGLGVLIVRVMWSVWCGQAENWAHLPGLRELKLRVLATRIDNKNATLLVQQPWAGVDEVSAAAALAVVAASLRYAPMRYRLVADRTALAPVVRHCKLPRLPADLLAAATAHAPVVLYERCDRSLWDPPGVVSCEYSAYGRRGLTRRKAPPIYGDDGESSSSDDDEGELRPRVVQLPMCLLREIDTAGDDADDTEAVEQVALEVGARIDAANITQTVEILQQKRARGAAVVDADGMLVVEAKRAPTAAAGGGGNFRHADGDGDVDDDPDLHPLGSLTVGECGPVLKALTLQYVALIQLPFAVAGVLDSVLPLGSLPPMLLYLVGLAACYLVVAPAALSALAFGADALAGDGGGGAIAPLSLRIRRIGTAVQQFVAEARYAIDVHIALCWWGLHLVVDAIVIPVVVGLLIVALTRQLLSFNDIFGGAVAQPARDGRAAVSLWDHMSVDRHGHPYTPAVGGLHGLFDVEYLASVFDPTAALGAATLPMCYLTPDPVSGASTRIDKVLAALLWGDGDVGSVAAHTPPPQAAGLDDAVAATRHDLTPNATAAAPVVGRDAGEPSTTPQSPEGSAAVADVAAESDTSAGETEEEEPEAKTVKEGSRGIGRRGRDVKPPRVVIDFARAWETAMNATVLLGVPVDPAYHAAPEALGAVDLGDRAATVVAQLRVLGREQFFCLWCAGGCALGVFFSVVSGTTSGVKPRVYRRMFSRLPMSEALLAEDFSLLRWTLTHSLVEQAVVWCVVIALAWVVALATIRAPMKFAASLRPQHFPMQFINVGPAHLAADMLFVNVYFAFSGGLSNIPTRIARGFAHVMAAVVDYLRLTTFLYGTDAEQLMFPPPQQLNLRLLTLCVALWVAIALGSLVCIAIPVYVGSFTAYIRADVSALDCFLVGLCVCMCVPHGVAQLYDVSMKALCREHGLPAEFVTPDVLAPRVRRGAAPPLPQAGEDLPAAPADNAAPPADAAPEVNPDVLSPEEIAAVAPPLSVIGAYPGAARNNDPPAAAAPDMSSDNDFVGAAEGEVKPSPPPAPTTVPTAATDSEAVLPELVADEARDGGEGRLPPEAEHALADASPTHSEGDGLVSAGAEITAVTPQSPVSSVQDDVPNASPSAAKEVAAVSGAADGVRSPDAGIDDDDASMDAADGEASVPVPAVRDAGDDGDGVAAVAGSSSQAAAAVAAPRDENAPPPRPSRQITAATLEEYITRGVPGASFVPPPGIVDSLRIIPASLFKSVLAAQKEGEGCNFMDSFKRGVPVNPAIAYTAMFLFQSGVFEVKRDRFGVVSAITVRRVEGDPDTSASTDPKTPLTAYEHEMLILLKLMLGNPADLLKVAPQEFTDREQLELCCQIWAQVLWIQEEGKRQRERAGLTLAGRVGYQTRRVLSLVYPSLALLANWVVIVVVFGIALPLMTGLLMELAATMPASVTADQSPKISLLPTFVIGFVYFELWIRTTVTNPDCFTHNWKEHWAKMHQNGLKDADATAAVVNLGVPAFSFLSAALCVPHTIHTFVLPVLAVYFPLAERIHYHRATHSLFLLAVIAYKAGRQLCTTLRPLLGRMCQSAYDESYLMGIWLEDRHADV